jgi:hypothetical protein
MLMKKHTFYLISIFMASIALGFHVIARAEILKGQHLTAKSMESTIKQQTNYEPNLNAERLSNSGRVFSKVGLAFTLCGLTCLVVAVRRHERGYYSIPILLLFFDFLEQVLLLS